MNNYLVKLVYQIICGDGNHAAQFDEQLRYVIAEDEDAALQKGRCIGVAEEESFANERGQLVQWKFIAACEIYSLTDAADGAEVCSQIRETGDAEGYRSFVRRKAAALCSALPMIQST